MTAAHLAYYQSVAGAWRGEVAVELTDEAAFAAAPLSWIDRLRINLQAQALGPTPRLTTSVALLGETHVRHTTRLTIAGAHMFDGAEIITLLPDGRRFELRGEHRFAPDYWRRRPVHGTGRVDGREARYELEWLGVQLRQQGRASPDGQTVVLVQETSFLKSTQVLKRLTNKSH